MPAEVARLLVIDDDAAVRDSLIDYLALAGYAVEIPFRSGAETLTAVIGGQVQFASFNMSEAAPGLSAGTMRAIMVTVPDKYPGVAGVQTAKEAGMPVLENLVGWNAVVGPPGLPDEVVAKWNATLAALKDDAEWKVIEPRITKVSEARRDMSTGFGFGRGGFGGRRGTDSSGGGGGDDRRRRGFGGEPSVEADALQKALEAKASNEELKAKFAKYRESLKQKQATLNAAQDELRKVLSLRQEATAVMMGVRMTVVLIDNRAFGCIHRLQKALGGEPFNNRLEDSWHTALPEIDFVAHARSMGAYAVKAADIAAFEAAIADARSRGGVNGIVIDTEATTGTPEGGTWWDVAVPEVSGLPGVTAARAAYEQKLKTIRDKS